MADRPQVHEAIVAGQVLSTIGLIVAAMFTILDAFTVWEVRGHLSTLRHATKSRAAVYLFAISFLGLWVIILCALMWWGNWTGNVQACPILVAPMVPIVYIVMKQCLYLFLFDRAKVVHDALKMNSLLIRATRWLVFLACTVGVPIATWWIFFVYWRGRVLPEGVCVQYADTIAGVVAVASLDFLLSLTMLGLFIAPLVTHMKKLGRSEDGSDNTMTPVFRRLVRRNLAVSFAMMVSTFTALVMMTIEFTIAHGATPDPNLDHVQIWATFFPLLDTILTVVLPHLLSNAWMPAPLRKFYQEHSRSSKSRVQDYAGSTPKPNMSPQPDNSVRLSSRVTAPAI